jgi:hypothetical protein
MVRLSCFVAVAEPCCEPEASEIFTVKLVEPAAVGVPEIVPALLNESPAGSDEPLASAQVNVPAPPLACKVAL